VTHYRTNDVLRFVGKKVMDTSGDKIGCVEAIYEDGGSGPEWFAISTARAGTDMSFVPIHGTTVDQDHVWLPWGNDVVQGAPRCEIDGHLSADEEARLYAYYGMEWASTCAPIDQRSAEERAIEDVDVDPRGLAGDVRLRKWVESEGANTKVPVRRTIARVVMGPDHARDPRSDDSHA